MYKEKYRKRKSLLFSIVLSVALPSWAEEQAFPAIFFKDFAPQNALDVVANIPGFTVDFGKSVRGLAGGGGNVLVDGIRVSSKSGGLEEVLARIPFAQIEKVIVTRGGQGVGDGSSQTVVANIIRKKVDTLGQMSLTMHYDSAGNWSPEAEVSYAGQIKEWQGNIKLDALMEDTEQRTRYRTESIEGGLFSQEQETKNTALNEFFISSDITKNLEHESLQITMRAGKSQYRPQLSRVQLNDVDRTFENDRNSIYHTAEIGADWRRDYTHWQWRSIGLINFTHWTIDRSSLYKDPLAQSSSQYDFQRNKWESILRNSFLQSDSFGATEFGLELTYNHINVNSSYYEIDSEGNRTNIVLPEANVEVSEVRADAFYSKQWRWSNDVSLSLGLAGEYSKISAEGDTGSEEDYFFLKPSFNLSKQWQNDWQTQLRLDRTVNQLDFKLYAAQSNADTNRDHAGNTQLKPDSFYELNLANDYQFSEKTALQFELFYRWYEDVLEHQLVSSGSSALVNSGNAEGFGGKLAFTYATDEYIPGGLLTLNWLALKTEHQDVITNESRRLTGEKHPDAEISFRQDLVSENLAWGITAGFAQDVRYYYVDEISDQTTELNWSGFIEYRGWQFGNVKLSLNKINNYEKREVRQFFSPDRAGELTSFAYIFREEKPVISLTLNSNF